mmetsp:Transcript_29395/g.85049  ORF Transcript_29395/g.85049 Transcript_29395/m.85049 type:complete len:287 (-) Transcript_29395:463-1323(-)
MGVPVWLPQSLFHQLVVFLLKLVQPGLQLIVLVLGDVIQSRRLLYRISGLGSLGFLEFCIDHVQLPLLFADGGAEDVLHFEPLIGRLGSRRILVSQQLGLVITRSCKMRPQLGYRLLLVVVHVLDGIVSVLDVVVLPHVVPRHALTHEAVVCVEICVEIIVIALLSVGILPFVCGGGCHCGHIAAPLVIVTGTAGTAAASLGCSINTGRCGCGCCHLVWRVVAITLLVDLLEVEFGKGWRGQRGAPLVAVVVHRVGEKIDVHEIFLVIGVVHLAVPAIAEWLQAVW